ncbi:MAG: helix-turn-helix transcriptional regulator [Azospirillaceae bacterium]|nr:helix-turn-helix transcriptional regulator [Azospirillaceae bacterium]
MIEPVKTRQHQEVGAFLRAQRSRLRPEAVGLPAGQRRRTPGLRREEVAQLCGMSVTWYSWIEQGRDVSVSPAALARVARALRLNRAERAYLFALAQQRDPAGDAEPADAVPASLVAAIAGFDGPAYLLDRLWDARAWNPAATRLFTGWLDAECDRNLLRFIFTAPGARRLIVGWEERARRVLAEFRADFSRHLDDTRLEALVDALNRRSPLFAQAWANQSVLDREGGLRMFDHPQAGPLRYQQVTLIPAGLPDHKLVVLVAAGQDDTPR